MTCLIIRWLYQSSARYIGFLSFGFIIHPAGINYKIQLPGQSCRYDNASIHLFYSVLFNCSSVLNVCYHKSLIIMFIIDFGIFTMYNIKDMSFRLCTAQLNTHVYIQQCFTDRRNVEDLDDGKCDHSWSAATRRNGDNLNGHRLSQKQQKSNPCVCSV